MERAAEIEWVADGPAASCDKPGRWIHLARRRDAGGCGIVDFILKDRPAKVVGSDLGAQDLAEITTTHQRSWNRGDLRGCYALSIDVNAGEKEGFVATV